MILDAPLYVLRHGETTWNTERRLQGTKDSNLTERGRAQALAMGRALRRELSNGEDVIVFLRSPLGRVRETSLLIGGELGLDPTRWREDPRLAEIGYGQWEGSTWDEIERERPNAYLDWKADPENFAIPDGEAHRRVRDRMAEVPAEIAASRRRTVIVGHGTSGAVLRGIHLGLDAQGTMALDKPQGAFFCLMAGTERRISAN